MTILSSSKLLCRDGAAAGTNQRLYVKSNVRYLITAASRRIYLVLDKIMIIIVLMYNKVSVAADNLLVVSPSLIILRGRLEQAAKLDKEAAMKLVLLS